MWICYAAAVLFPFFFCTSTVSASTASPMASVSMPGLMRSSDPAAAADQNLLHEQLVGVLSMLDAREREVIDFRFGLNDGNCRTLGEIGRMFNISRERVRQIESKAIRMLRTPSRMRYLRGYVKSA